jgi:hypothetical protein
MNLGCNVLEGNIDICPNQIGGSASIYSDFDPAPFGSACNNIDFHGNVVNISFNDTCQSYHYSGNLTATVSDNYGFNSNIITSDNITANDIPSGVYNYTMNVDINLCRTELVANLTLCNSGSCVVYDPNGMCVLDDSNSTCTKYLFMLIIHSVNKTSMYE